jgi:hypothetical protein
MFRRERKGQTMKAIQVLSEAGPELELGARYRDKVSGWEGTLTACYVYMNGCVRCELADKDDKAQPKAFVFDQEQITLVTAKPVATKRATPTGGSRDSSPVER